MIYVSNYCNEYQTTVKMPRAALQVMTFRMKENTVRYIDKILLCLLHDEAIHQRREVCNIKSNAHFGVHWT